MSLPYCLLALFLSLAAVILAGPRVLRRARRQLALWLHRPVPGERTPLSDEEMHAFMLIVRGRRRTAPEPAREPR